MNNVNGITGTAAMGTASSLPGKQLNQADFMKLMIEQFRDQDPTKPMNTDQMVGQMAQFSQIAAVQQMQSSFSQLATSLQGDQVLRAANLIGRQVMVPASQANVSGNGTGVTGAVNVPGPINDLQVNIVDAGGAVVRTLDLGAQPAGLAKFHWDGMDADGKQVAPGSYSIASSLAGHPLTTYVSGTVAGIDSSAGSTAVQVSGVGDVAINQIAQIL